MRSSPTRRRSRFFAGRRRIDTARLSGRIVTREKYAIAYEKGSQLRQPIDAVLRQVRADGTLAQLRRRWLGTDTATLPALR